MIRPIIGLTGPAGCGKSTAAAYLEGAHGYERIRFAGPLKAMLRAFLAASGLGSTEIERMIEGDLKEVTSAALGERSPRFVMQRLGTEFGRDMLHPELWTRAWVRAVGRAFSQGAAGVVVEDCRFPNEAEAIRALGGIVVAVRRPNVLALAEAHASEGQAVTLDDQVRNDGSVLQLGTRLDALVDRYRELAA